MQLHELCALRTDNLFPAALAAVLSSSATGEPLLLRCTAQRHRNGPAWASNDALSKALAHTRVPQHLLAHLGSPILSLKMMIDGFYL